MLRQLVTGFLLCLLSSNAPSQDLKGKDALADLALARQALETIHPGYDRYTDKAVLDRYWESVEQNAAKGIGPGDLYVELSFLLAQIRCDHTLAELPEAMAKQRDSLPAYLPFRFRLFDDRMYVDVAGDTGLSRGEEILSVDGVPIAQWLSILDPLVPVDGDSRQSKPPKIEYSAEFQGGAFDHFASLLTPLLPVAARLEVRNTNGETRTVFVERIGYEAYQGLTGEKRYSRNFDTSVRFETVGDDGAYLAVDTFVNYRQPVNPVEFLKPYFVQLEKEGRDKLIVDLRRNGGGSDDAQTALLRYLISKPVLQREGVLTRITSIEPDIRPHINTWDQAALNPDPDWYERAADGFYRFVAGPAPTPVEPLPHAFTGEVVILTSPTNASGVTHMLANLANHGGFTFVGDKTGGAPTGATANVIFFLKLPESGIVIRLPVQRTLIAGRESLPQRDGLAPDVPVPQTAEDYFNGIDRTFEVAKEALGL